MPIILAQRRRRQEDQKFSYLSNIALEASLGCVRLLQKQTNEKLTQKGCVIIYAAVIPSRKGLSEPGGGGARL